MPLSKSLHTISAGGFANQSLTWSSTSSGKWQTASKKALTENFSESPKCTQHKQRNTPPTKYLQITLSIILFVCQNFLSLLFDIFLFGGLTSKAPSNNWSKTTSWWHPSLNALRSVNFHFPPSTLTSEWLLGHQHLVHTMDLPPPHPLLAQPSRKESTPWFAEVFPGLAMELFFSGILLGKTFEQYGRPTGLHECSQ